MNLHTTQDATAAPEDRSRPGTHRRRIRIAWDERVTYEQVFDLDVPDGFTGDLWDLIRNDDAAFRDGDVAGIPAGYRCGWLDQIEPSARFAIEDRCIYDVTDVTDLPTAPATPSLSMKDS